jgi:hypothetical protein
MRKERNINEGISASQTGELFTPTAWKICSMGPKASAIYVFFTHITF